MKKTIFVLICILLLVFPVLAGGQSIVDEADLLGESQVSRLEEHAQQIEESYNIDIVILTVPTTHGVDAAAFADEFYLTNGYGDNGILLLLVMDSRDWVISTWGTIADTMSTSDCDSLFASAADYISAGDYERGFERYLDQLPMYVYPPHVNGVPKEMPDWGKLGIALLVGCVGAGIVLIVMISSMRTARPKRSAAEYVNRGSFRMSVQRDLYLYSTTTRTKIESNNSSGSHRSSSGRSHGGSRGKF